MDYQITTLTIDSHGYYRDQNNYLVHRTLAFRLLYLPNRHLYELPFNQYQVHHIDRNKQNNLPHNLLILTNNEHNFLHWVCMNCEKWNLCKDKYVHNYTCPKKLNKNAWKYYRDVCNYNRR
jgi:hypothetical protein